MKIKEQKQKIRMRNGFETWVGLGMKHGFQLWRLVGLRLTVWTGDDVWQRLEMLVAPPTSTDEG